MFARFQRYRLSLLEYGIKENRLLRLRSAPCEEQFPNFRLGYREWEDYITSLPYMHTSDLLFVKLVLWCSFGKTFRQVWNAKHWWSMSSRPDKEYTRGNFIWSNKIQWALCLSSRNIHNENDNQNSWCAEARVHYWLLLNF